MAWETAYDLVLDTNIGTAGERNYRNVIDANRSAHDGTKIRISVTASPTGAAVIDGSSIGVMTADDDFDVAPTRITWVDAGGGNGITIPAGTTKVSDEITFDFDKTVRHGVHFYLLSKIYHRYVVTGHDDYYYVIGGGDQTMQQIVSYALADNDAVCLDLLEVFVGAAEYSLVVDAGSFALSGQTTNLLKSSLIDTVAGAYVETGQAAGLYRNYELLIGAGSFILTGQAASLLKSSLIDIGSGVYVLTGTAADFVYTVGFLYKERLMDAYLEEKINLSGLLEEALNISGKTEEALTIKAILRKTLIEE